eukprot:2376184-Pyramimonas_sp.AAC.1
MSFTDLSSEWVLQRARCARVQVRRGKGGPPRASSKPTTSRGGGTPSQKRKRGGGGQQRAYVGLQVKERKLRLCNEGGVLQGAFQCVPEGPGERGGRWCYDKLGERAPETTRAREP